VTLLHGILNILIVGAAIGAIWIWVGIFRDIGKRVLAHLKKKPTDVERLLAAISEMQASRLTWIVMEQESMTHWEKLCQCPDSAVEAARRRQAERFEEVRRYHAQREERFMEEYVPFIRPRHDQRNHQSTASEWVKRYG
jgi:hypothetical protein